MVTPRFRRPTWQRGPLHGMTITCFIFLIHAKALQGRFMNMSTFQISNVKVMFQKPLKTRIQFPFSDVANKFEDPLLEFCVFHHQKILERTQKWIEYASFHLRPSQNLSRLKVFKDKVHKPAQAQDSHHFWNQQASPWQSSCKGFVRFILDNLWPV